MHSKLWLVIAIILMSVLTAWADTTFVTNGIVNGNWTAEHSPYMIRTDIMVLGGNTLTIGAGVTVYFDGYYALTVYGSVQAIGTEQDSIYFTTDTLANPDQYRHVSFLSAGSSELAYCVIEHARAVEDAAPGYDGGGLYVDVAAPTIRHCSIRHNHATAGGAVYATGVVSLVMTDCDISENWAYNVGGGIVANNIVLQSCTMRENQAGNEAGGVLCPTARATQFTGCDFRDNYALENGGAIEIQYAAGITPVTIDHCTFTGNWIRQSGGGAVRIGGGRTIRIMNSQFLDNAAVGFGWASGGAIDVESATVTMDHCLFARNYAYDNGGAVYAGSQAHAILTQCTVAGNDVDGYWGAQISGMDCDSLVINSCIIAFSTAGHIGLSAYNLQPRDFSLHNTLFYANGDSDLNSGNQSVRPLGFGQLVRVNRNHDSTDAYGNLFVNPLFADTATGNYHLTATSPCVNAGDSTLPLDLDSSIADIGAFPYEVPSAVTPHSAPTPRVFSLACYPNPFNSSATISFDLPQAAMVEVRIFNVVGQHVASLAGEPRAAGQQRLLWNGTGNDGAPLSSGVYLCRVDAGQIHATTKVVLIR